MASTITWSDTALRDLEAIATYIAQDSPHFAVVTVERIVMSVQRLLEFPQSGRIVPEFNRPDLHEVIMRPYRIVYEIIDDEITVVTVIHSSRDI